MAGPLLAVALAAATAAGSGSYAYAAEAEPFTVKAQSGTLAAELVARHHTVDADRARASSSFAVTGVLVDQENQPVADAILQVDLYPGPVLLAQSERDGIPAASLPLGQAKTSAKGEFTLRIPALKNIESYMKQDGSVELFFSGVGRSDVAFYYNQEVFLPAKKGARAKAAVIDPRRLGASKRPTARMDLSAAIAPDGRSEDTVVDVDAADLLFVAYRDGDADMGTMSENVWCAESVGAFVTWGWFWESYAATMPWVAIQNIVTLGKSTAKYEFDSSSASKVESGFDIIYKGTKTKGGYVSASHTSSGGSSSRPNNWRGFVETQMEERYQRLECLTNTRGWVYANVKQLRPYRHHGGTQNMGTDSAYHSCKSGTDVYFSYGNTTWVAHSSTSTFAGEVSYGGFSLGASQTNGGARKLTYTATAASGALICGSNNYVQYAAKVREIYR